MTGVQDAKLKFKSRPKLSATMGSTFSGSKQQRHLKTRASQGYESLGTPSGVLTSTDRGLSTADMASTISRHFHPGSCYNFGLRNPPTLKISGTQLPLLVTTIAFSFRLRAVDLLLVPARHSMTNTKSTGQVPAKAPDIAITISSRACEYPIVHFPPHRLF